MSALNNKHCTPGRVCNRKQGPEQYPRYFMTRAIGPSVIHSCTLTSPERDVRAQALRMWRKHVRNLP